MTETLSRQAQLAAVLKSLRFSSEIRLRCWEDGDLPTIQRLATLQGWPTYHDQDEVLSAWRNSWPALVVTREEQVIGYIRGMTDGVITTHISDLLVDANYRGKGLGSLLLEACHLLYPRAALNLVAEELAIPFYKTVGFRYAGEAYFNSYR